MKKKLSIFALSLLALSANAQTIYEAANLLGEDLNGTARYVAMGGAMSALGGDISVIRTNPAGIGLYRSNDVVVTFGTNTASTSLLNSNYNKTTFSFDNAGFVYAMDLGRQSPVRFLNLAFNYKKRKNFNRKWRGSWNDATTQTDLIAEMATGYSESDFTNPSAFVTDRPYTGWLPIMAYNAWLIDPVGDTDWIGFYPADSFGHYYEVNESGWINDYDFNMSWNLYDKVYFGMTLTAVDVKYQKSAYYSENFYDGDYNSGFYDLQNYFSTSGGGLAFSMGIIARLHDNLRLGFSFSTPTIYWLKDYQDSSIGYDVDVDVDVVDETTGATTTVTAVETGVTYPYDAYERATAYEYSYRVRTPWKINASIGATLLNRLAIGAEYEYQDAAKTRIMYEDGFSIDALNYGYYDSTVAGIAQSFDKQHTVKVGGEFRVTPQFFVRAGFNYATSFMKETSDIASFKFMESESARTDTEYENVCDRWALTAGLGYNKNFFYLDLAYKFSKYNSDFYAYDNLDLLPLTLSNKRHQLLLTFGLRF